MCVCKPSGSPAQMFWGSKEVRGCISFVTWFCSFCLMEIYGCLLGFFICFYCFSGDLFDLFIFTLS